MAEVSNKTLALLLIAAIVISMGGMLMTLNRLSRIRFFAPGITGLVTDTGTVSLSIAETVSINFSQDQMDFGAGAVDSNAAGCLVQNNYTNGSNKDNSGSALPFTNNCTTDDFNGNVSGFLVENIGNMNVTLNITGKTARSFFGVSGGNYSFNISPKGTEVACQNASAEAYWDNIDGSATNFSRREWGPFEGTAAANEIKICNESSYGFQYAGANDEFYINIRMNVPGGASGALTDTITLEGTSYEKNP